MLRYAAVVHGPCLLTNEHNRRRKRTSAVGTRRTPSLLHFGYLRSIDSD